jgi:hypothetical protein
MDPSGLPSITSVAVEEFDVVDDDGLDEPHAATPSALRAHAKAASGSFTLIMAPQCQVGRLPPGGLLIASL